MTKAPAFSLTVYCGSKMGCNPAFERVAMQVGQWIGRRGGQLVYGGGNSGLMGVLADATLQAGGHVVGIIPSSMVEREWAHHALDELLIVENMHERKAQMIERGHALLALPGGIGTLDEFFEAWTWRQLGFHDKPIGLLNVHGFYDGLLNFLQSTVNQDFLSSPHLGLIQVGDQVDEFLTALVQSININTNKSGTMNLS